MRALLKFDLPLKTLNSQNGNTLIILIISLAVSGIMMAAMMSFFTNQMKAQKHLAQKYEMLDLQNSIMSSMARSKSCTAQLTAINAKITPKGKDYSPISLTSLKSTDDANARTLVQSNDSLPGTTTGLKVSTVELKILSGGASNIYDAQFEITFDPSSTQGSFKPVTVSQKVIKDSITDKIISCASADLDADPNANNNDPNDVNDNEVGTMWKLTPPPGMPPAVTNPCIVLNKKLLPAANNWVPSNKSWTGCKFPPGVSILIANKCYNSSDGAYSYIRYYDYKTKTWVGGIGTGSTVFKYHQGCNLYESKHYQCPLGTIVEPTTQLPYYTGDGCQG